MQLVLEPIRDYPSGALTSHIVGYMGHIPEDHFTQYEEKGYLQDEWAWPRWRRASREAFRGKPGRQTIEVDVHGRRVRTVGDPDSAQPGHNLVLSLDLDLQRAATEALAKKALDKSEGFTKATQGVVIAIDTRNGKILALVSLPGYDNNLFAKGITTEAWNRLTSNPDLPLVNRAIVGLPPGSTFNRSSPPVAWRRAPSLTHPAGRRL